MGKGLLEFYRNRIKTSWKTAFISTFVIGLLIHLYKFTNTLPVPDSLYSVYSAEDILGSGRWFLSTACVISSFYDLPWFNGLLAVCYIALTAAVVTDIFDMENPVCIILTGGLLASFPAMTETMYFEYTADGYMLAMLLASLSVRLSLPGDRQYTSRRKTIAAAVLLCLTAGIYQAYVSFALMLWLAYLIMSLLSDRLSRADYTAWMKKMLIVLFGGMIAYYGIWKLLMAVRGTGANDYLGINEVGQKKSPVQLLYAAYNSYHNIFFYFTDANNTKEYGPSVMTVLHIIFAVFFAAVIAAAARRSGILRSKKRFILALACLAVTPFAVYLWLFSSPEMGYGPRMEQSICVYFILFLVLAERWLGQRAKDAAALLLAAVVFVYALSANICYFYLQSCYEYSYASAVELAARVHMADDGTCDKLLIGGSLPARNGTADIFEEKAFRTIGPYDVHIHQLVYSREPHLSMFLQYYTGFRLAVQYDDGEYATAKWDESDGKWKYTTSHVAALAGDPAYEYILASEEYARMNCWPAEGCVRVIDGYIVVKMPD